MKKLLLMLLVAFSLQAHAQISITQTEMPYAGDELYRTRANNNPFLNYGATGANHVWNFSNLVATTQDSAIYQSVSSTNFVYALVYVDLFFNPNRANHAKSGTDLPFSNLLPINDPFTFYYRNSSVYKKVGYGAELAGIPLPIIYTDHDEIYSLPLNYGDNDSTFSSYNVSIPTLAYYGYEQSRLNNVDGWGTITTPSGTFDVIKVKTTLIGKDTIQLDTLNVGFTIDRPVVKEYKWLANNIRVPILQINTTTIFGIELITDVFFYDDPRSISVSPPLVSTLCPGSTIQVNYDKTGAFNPGGLFNAPNVFRAQLSDANGSFATPINIGSVTSTQSGVINATIPANIALGSGYRIRVISTNPAFIGNDNGFDLSIGSAPVASASASGSTVFCDGGSVILSSATDPSYSYQWQLNGNDLNGEVTSDLLAEDSGNYTVVVTNTCGSSTSVSIPVVINDLPVHSFTQSNLFSCNGSPVVISSQNTTGQTSLIYQWFLDGILLAGETNADITSNVPGNYTLEITNTITGCSYTTTAVQLSDDLVTMPVITSNGSTTFCDGGSVLLSILPEPSVTYQWFADGIIVPGATDPDLLATSTGVYTVQASNINGCSVLSATAIDVTVNPLPNAANVIANGTTNFCQGNSILLEFIPEPGVDYQWQLDGVDISGANASSLVVAASGNYTVISTSVNGCTGQASNVITVTVESLPILPVVTTSDPTTFCDGGSASLEIIPEPGINYQWYVDGVLISGANGSSYSATASGNYSVVATSLSGCTATANPGINVTVNSVPAQPVLSAMGPTVFCQGGNVIISFIAEPGVNYQWQVDGVDIPGAVNPGILAASSGIYTVNAIGAGGCSSSSVTGVTIVVNPLPAAPVITVIGNTTFCDGGSVTLEVPVQSGMAYQWTLNNNNIPGANSNQYTITANSGDYTVNVIDSNGCASLSTITYQVIINPLPPAPVITQYYDTLFASGSGPFQWYLDGNLIAGATLSYVVAAVNGNYTVQISDNNGCENVSSVFPYNSVGVSEITTLETLIYPNPSNGIFNLVINSSMVGKLNYTLIDKTGKIIETGELTEQKSVIDISNRASGLYILRINGGAESNSIKLSKL